MATPVGTNVLTSLSRRYLHDQVVDNVYLSNPLTFRLIAQNKKLLQGGYQIEIPQMFQDFTVGGWYAPYDQLDTTPQDTVKNAAFDWANLAVPITVDNPTLAKSDSPEAVMNLLTLQFGQAEMRAVDLLGTGAFSNGVTNTKSIVGITGAVDDGTTLATYGGLARASNTFWKSTIDSSTATLTALSMRTAMTNAEAGGRTPTLIVTTPFLYNRFWNLNQPNQAFPVQPQGTDTQLFSVGASNQLFDMVPLMKDSHCPVQNMFYLNETYWILFVKTGLDFFMEDFVKQPNQDIYIAWLKWMGLLVCMNPARNSKMTALTA